MPMKTYVIHATCRYVVQNKETKQTESGQRRPTISVDAGSEKAAIAKATRDQKEAISSEWWPCLSFHLIPELVNVIEHPTAAQRRVLVKLDAGGNTGATTAMKRRLVEKGWIEGSNQEGYKLTAAGRREIG